MVVALTWSSLATPVTPLSDPEDTGSVDGTAGGTTTPFAVFLSHDGTNEITNAGFYIQPYSGSGYTGTGGPMVDFQEVLSWGDADTGGLEIDQIAGGSGAGPYTRFTTTAGVAGSTIALAATAGGGGAGQIDPSPAYAEVWLEFTVPAGTTPAGIRFVDICMQYDYTS